VKALVLVLAAVALVSLGARALRAGGDDPHERWARGDCGECHRDDAVAGAHPAYHTEPGWDVVHGRSPQARPERCLSCHQADECRDCHARPPDTHTAGFRRPAGAGDDARRHAILGRLRPSACATCHVDVVTECDACHSPRQSAAWAEDTRWLEVLR
jgi:hypothetical protein